MDKLPVSSLTDADKMFLYLASKKNPSVYSLLTEATPEQARALIGEIGNKHQQDSAHPGQVRRGDGRTTVSIANYNGPLKKLAQDKGLVLSE